MVLAVVLVGGPSPARAGDDDDQGWKHGRHHGRTKHGWDGGHRSDWGGSPVRPWVSYQRQPMWFSLPSQLNIVIPIQID